MLCRHNQLVMYLSEYIPFFKQHMVVCVYSILTWKATVDTQKIINWYFTSCALIANTQIRKEMMIFLGVYFLEWGSPLSAFKDKLCTNAKRGLSGMLALSPASSLFWIYSPVQVTLLPYACFLNLTELPQTGPLEVCTHFKWHSNATDTYHQGSLLTFLVYWGPSMSQHPFDITYRDQLLRISIGQ